MREKYSCIVVGGGIAGVSCLESLQFWHSDASVLLISASTCVKAVTNALQLSKTLVQFDVEEQEAGDVAKKYDNVDVLIDKVRSVDSDKHLVFTEHGGTFQYEKLCLATGGRPKLIAESNPLVIGIRDTDSVLTLKEKLSNARRIVVVGNGGIATELMYEVSGVEKVWVIKDQYISSTFVDEAAAEFLKDSLFQKERAGQSDTVIKRMRYTTGSESHAALGPDWHVNHQLLGASQSEDIDIVYGTTVSKVEDNEGGAFPLRVVLENGRKIEADIVISATGVVPCSHDVSIKPLHPEIASDGGIAVNSKLETSVMDIFAAGDVATAGWTLAPHWHQMRLWTQARQMGQYVGKTMAHSLRGELCEMDFCFELFSHVTKFFGFKVILLGLFNIERQDRDCELLLRVTKGKEYVKLVTKGGKIQGAILIGETDLEEMCENLILDQLDVSQYGEDLLNPDIDIDDYFD